MQKTKEEELFEKNIVLTKGVKFLNFKNGQLQSEIDELKYKLQQYNPERDKCMISNHKYDQKCNEVKNLKKKINSMVKSDSRYKKVVEERDNLRETVRDLHRKNEELLIKSLKKI